MTGPRWPRSCSHPIYVQTLTGVYQVVRTFSPCYFHVIISIGILESIVSRKFIISQLQGKSLAFLGIIKVKNSETREVTYMCSRCTNESFL